MINKLFTKLEGDVIGDWSPDFVGKNWDIYFTTNCYVDRD